MTNKKPIIFLFDGSIMSTAYLIKASQTSRRVKVVTVKGTYPFDQEKRIDELCDWISEHVYLDRLTVSKDENAMTLATEHRGEVWDIDAYEILPAHEELLIVSIKDSFEYVANVVDAVMYEIAPGMDGIPPVMNLISTCTLPNFEHADHVADCLQPAIEGCCGLCPECREWLALCAERYSCDGPLTETEVRSVVSDTLGSSSMDTEATCVAHVV
jgi:hypothetical protein